mmetsp:Transcript_97995/g.158059  ORF Transcript_97995/g.158059 Transcript_97995/m.158059 type:complete len:103 (-) Transcript_97995:1107-1415(-)
MIDDKYAATAVVTAGSGWSLLQLCHQLVPSTTLLLCVAIRQRSEEIGGMEINRACRGSESENLLERTRADKYGRTKRTCADPNFYGEPASYAGGRAVVGPIF